MSESKFDSEIKRILSGAEMPVSPSAWEGIASRLPAKKVAFPIWRYAAVAGIAAALAVGVFLLKPGSTPDEGAVADVIISQEIPSISEQIEAAAAESAVALTESPAAKAEPRSVSRQSSARPSAISAPESIGTDAVETNDSEEGQATESRQTIEDGTDSEPIQDIKDVQPEKQEQETASSDDSRLLAMLAAEQGAAPRRFFLTASANLQGTEHQAASGRAAFRAPAKSAPEKTGISWENPEFNFTVPVTAGIGLQLGLNKHWSIGSGIQYTNMSRSFIGDYTEIQEEDGDIFTLEQTDIINTQHWLGIPLNVYYEILPQSKWSIHAFAGGALEYLLTNHYLVHTSGNDIHYSEAGKGVQLSVGGGVGVEYRFTPSFGLFFDPSLRFYFNNGQPRSIRTIQPLRMDFQAGVRFTL